MANRAQRRMAKGKNTDQMMAESLGIKTPSLAPVRPIQHLIQDKINEQIKDAAKKEAARVVDHMVDTLVAGFMMALHDKEGYGTKRLNRVYEQMIHQVDCISSGVVSPEDMMSYLEAIGVNLEITRERVNKCRSGNENP